DGIRDATVTGVQTCALPICLSLDPGADVTLAEEIDLQRLYLDIEKARFPDRLHVEIEVPSDLERARLPALILQPLVENAIKYGEIGRASCRERVGSSGVGGV